MRTGQSWAAAANLPGPRIRRDLGPPDSGAAAFPPGRPNSRDRPQRLDIGALGSRPPEPRPRYLAACSARSASRANWSVPKKSTRQGGFSRTRAPQPFSTTGDPQSLASARHWGIGLRPAPLPPPGKGPQQRLTNTLIASAGRLTLRRRVGLTGSEACSRAEPGSCGEETTWAGSVSDWGRGLSDWRRGHSCWKW